MYALVNGIETKPMCSELNGNSIATKANLIKIS